MKHKNKSSSKHVLIMVIGCILPLFLLYIASKYFGFSAGYLWGFIILCVGMHIWMMKEHKEGGKKTVKNHNHKGKKITSY